ncbi:putative reverse transcriptase domain-containing protein [Tanacetum coccineum]
MSPSMEARIAEYVAAPAPPLPPLSPLSPWSPPLPQIPSPPLPPLPSSLHLPPHVPTSLSLPSSQLPVSLFIPPLFDRRKDIPEAELPPRKRLCLTAPTSRYEVGESLTAAPRPTGGHRADYRFIGTMGAEIRRQRAEEVGYGIRDVWVDPTEAVEEVAPTTLEGVNDIVIELAAVQEQDTQDIYVVIEDTQDRQTQLFQRVDGLVKDRQFHYKTARLLDREALISREAWAHSVGLSSTGQLSAALGQIQALQARDQTHADDPEGPASTNNMPPRRSSATVRAVATATPMTATVVEQLIKARVSGTEGVVVLSQWFEKIESVFHISNYVMENQWKALKKMMTVKYCPKELALMCGRMFHEESEEVEKYVGGLPDMIRGNVMSYQPKTMEKAIEFANDQMDQKVLTFTERQAEQKRKSSGHNGNNNNRGNFGTTQNAVTCYECGVHGHFKKDCPKLKNGNYGNQRGNGNAPAKVYVVGNPRTNPDSNVITELGSFDVIIGMDWLSKYHAVIDCAEKIIRIPWGNETLIVHGDRTHVTTKETEDKSGEKRLEDVPIVRDFPKVFLEDLSGSSVYLKIDLRSGYHHLIVREEDIPKKAFKTRQLELDHKSLQHILDQKELNMRQRRWKEQIKPLRVRALMMTIGLDLPKQILNAQTEAQKPENLKNEDVGGVGCHVMEVVTRHGIPVSIICERGPRFASNFWRSLQKALGTNLDMSTAYHLQTDGQSDRTIQTLKDMLRACVINFGNDFKMILRVTTAQIPKVQFLGHMIDSQGIHVDPAKIEYIKDWASPKNPTEIRQFLGLDDYYRRFIEGFSKITKPMTKLTQKKVAFEWGDKQEAVFQTLKKRLCSAPILALPQGAEDFIIYCDASHKGLGAVLMQNEKVITYASRRLKIHEKNYTTHDLELGIVVFALKI